MSHAETLSPEEQAKLEKKRQNVMTILKEFDKNGDGQLCEQEIDIILKQYNNPANHKDMDPRVLEVLRQYDINKDGVLNSSEIEQVIHDVKTTDTNVRYVGYTRSLGILARYLAFTSDFGEAFRPVAHPRLVTATYGVSWMYCIGDVSYEAYKAHQRKQSREEITRLVTERSIFQVFASMAFPAALIHTQVRVAKKVFNRMGRFQRWGPSAAGLALIPFLPLALDKPVEHAVEWLSNRFGPWTKKSEAHGKHH
eukprot:TRINITY_DN3755_c0_g2_i1.p1 TRINITY_DN3755_c0_g2~~TRINITY_DN3755_c0_g2_i1.p1  ORF type:complete len:253 (-),score=61.89 TRINITY_DN3755_c0_g2_i1:148-906(-)